MRINCSSSNSHIYVFINRFDCALSEDCLISIDSFWGKRGKVSTIIRSQLEYLPIELFGEKGVSHEEENVENDERKDDDIEKEVDGEESSRRRRRHGFDKRETKRPEPVAMSVLQPSPYRLRLNSRLSTSVEGWESLRIRILHTEHDPLHLKTDIDIQVLPPHIMITLLLSLTSLARREKFPHVSPFSRHHQLKRRLKILNGLGRREPGFIWLGI